jgi:hypothetical protein
MEYYQEHLRGSRIILCTDHKPLETLGTLHMKTMKKLKLAIMDFNFEIRYKKILRNAPRFPIKQFYGNRSNLSNRCQLGTCTNLIRECLKKKLIYKFPMLYWYKKAEFIANMAVLENNMIWINRNDKVFKYMPFEISTKITVCSLWRSA